MPDPTTIPSLIPMPGKVYLRRLEPAAASSPYLIPDQSKEKGTEAEVLAIPSQPNYEYGILIPCPLSPGDRVVIGKYSGEHDWNGRKITIVRIDEILAVIQPEPADPTADRAYADSLASGFIPDNQAADRAAAAITLGERPEQGDE